MTTNITNPLLLYFNTPYQTVPFDKIKTKHYLPAIKEGIKLSEEEITMISNNTVSPSFENTIEALEKSGNLLEKVSTVFFNLNSAETNDDMQKIAHEISPLLTEHYNNITLNSKLFQKVKTIYENYKNRNLTIEQNTLLDSTYKSFVRSGANLNDKDKEEFREISKKLSVLSLKFGDNLLAETNAYQLVIENENDLCGLPESIKEMAKQNENQWVFTLEAPSYIGFMTYADNRNLREKLFKAYTQRAIKNNEFDNREIVKKIVNLRLKYVKLLGYKNYAAFVLERRMSETPQKVNQFLKNILTAALPLAKKNVDALKSFIKDKGENIQLQRWDWMYYSEKLKEQQFKISDKKLKPYFKLENVISGIFTIANKLYGLNFTNDKTIPVYHKDVKTYTVMNELGQHIAIFYADFFPRKGKRDGAWMTNFREQKIDDNQNNIRPHVSIVCNFTKPTSTEPSLLTFNEVLTLFHEFGHSLHSILSNCKYESLSGTNVYRDFVELPSQLLENWAFEKECLDLFAIHHQTGKKIPHGLINKIKATKNFNEGYACVRQISFSLLDMAWHSIENAKIINNVEDFEQKTILPTELFPPVEGSNLSVVFSHIFQGGYAAGYYGYKWAEVLDADAFSFFKKKGIFNHEIANKFKENILMKGGSEHPMTLYKRFRGQEPELKPFFERSGF